MEENTLFLSPKQINRRTDKALTSCDHPTRQRVLAEEGRATLV